MKDLTGTTRGMLGWFIAALVLFSAHLSWAGEPVGWEDLELYGGQVSALAINPTDPNVLFAGSWYGDGLFKSTDGGGTWQSVEGFRNRSVYSLSFDRFNPAILWVADSQGIHKSQDGGLTWQAYDPGRTNGRRYYSVAVDPADGNTVFVGTSGNSGSHDNGRIYKTTNGGSTWAVTSLVADHNVWSIAVNPTNDFEVWAVTGPDWVNQGSIYRSRDRGATWSKIITSLPEGWFWLVAMNPQTPGTVFVAGENGVYRTRDGGVTWSPLTPFDWCRGFAFDSVDATRVYASWTDKGTGNSFFARSDDGGDRWTSELSPYEFLCLASPPLQSGVVYGGEGHMGALRSDDGGETWNFVNQGIRANQVFAAERSSGGTILAGTQSGVFLKRPAGEWEWINPDPAYAVAFTPGYEQVIYAGFSGKMGKSTTSGQSWSYVDIPSTATNKVASIAVNPRAVGVLYLGVSYESGTKGELYKSSDGGAGIRLVQSFTVPVNAVAVNAVIPETVYAGTGLFSSSGRAGAIYRSTDSGERWSLVRSGIVVNTLASQPGNANSVYAGCGASSGALGGLLASTDGGATWQSKSFGIPSTAAIKDLEFDAGENNTLYAATWSSGIYLSPDGGNYWTILGLPDYRIYAVVSNPVTAARAEAALPSNELFAGISSGMLKFTGSGLGTIGGMLTDARRGSGITGASLSTTTGGKALSSQGSYLMVLPAGNCTVSVTLSGYQALSKTGVTVAAGEETSLDMSLVPLSYLNVSHIMTDFVNSSIPPAPGQNIRVSFTATGKRTPLYYKYWVSPGYQTENYGAWQLLKEWSTESSVIWAPPEEGNYVLLAWVGDDPTSPVFQQAGLSLETRGNSVQPVMVKGLVSDMKFPLPRRTAVKFNAIASGGQSTLQYRYYTRKEGGNWVKLRDYDPLSSCTWTPTTDGVYTVVVWVTDDTSLPEPPIIGTTCTVGQ